MKNHHLEEEKVYKMKLCTPKYPEKAFNDLGYYNTSKGMFYGEDLLNVLEEILVVPSKRNYVKEIVSGIQIPLICVEVEKEYLPVSYNCSILGDAKKMTFVCTVIKQKDIDKTKDREFLLEEASDVDIIHYEKEHQNKEKWQQCLMSIITNGNNIERQFLEAQKEKLKEKRKEQILKLFKWAKLED